MQKGIMCYVVCGQCRDIGCSNSAQTDESDGDLDAHQNEDRTDPMRTKRRKETFDAILVARR